MQAINQIEVPKCKHVRMKNAAAAVALRFCITVNKQTSLVDSVLLARQEDLQRCCTVNIRISPPLPVLDDPGIQTHLCC
jgi:hypothetical protein